MPKMPSFLARADAGAAADHVKLDAARLHLKLDLEGPPPLLHLLTSFVDPEMSSFGSRLHATHAPCPLCSIPHIPYVSYSPGSIHVCVFVCVSRACVCVCVARARM